MEQEYNVPECPICFANYDNVFKTPLLLPCSHTFCMECLAKICVFHKELETFSCPMCRGTVTIPPGGVPKLPPNMSVVSQFPPWMGQLQEVWMEGSKLCWRKDKEQSHGTSTQSATRQYPAEENIIVTVYLLGPAQATFSPTADLVTIPRPFPFHPVRAMLRNYGCILWIFVCCILLLFIVIFFPIRMRF